MNIISSSLIIVFKDSGDGRFGKANIFVDDRYVKTADPHENGWTHCNPVILYNDAEVRKHLVEIKMSAYNEDKYFTILGFGYTI